MDSYFFLMGCLPLSMQILPAMKTRELFQKHESIVPKFSCAQKTPICGLNSVPLSTLDFSVVMIPESGNTLRMVFMEIVSFLVPGLQSKQEAGPCRCLVTCGRAGRDSGIAFELRSHRNAKPLPPARPDGEGLPVSASSVAVKLLFKVFFVDERQVFFFPGKQASGSFGS